MFSSDEVNRSRTAFIGPLVTQAARGFAASATGQTSHAVHVPGWVSLPGAQPTGACRRSGSSRADPAASAGPAATTIPVVSSATTTAAAAAVSHPYLDP